MKKIIIGIATVVLLIGAALLFTVPSENNSKPNEAETVSSLQDAHGLAVGRKNASKVYIATHTGLLALNNDAELQRVSDAQDDYMGFSAHPTDPKIFYSSGHPRTGGNIGFQKSTDGGKTWQKISNGVGGPVDYHAMAVSQADPSIVYGVYRGQLQRSNDEGKEWQVIPNSLGNIIVLATSPNSKDTVYAGTTEGFSVSQNQGVSWSKLNLSNTVVAAAVNPKNEQQIIAYSQDQGLVLSNDGGSTWNKQVSYSGSAVMQIAYDVQNPATIYLINQNLEVYKTNDGAGTWKKVR